jgi:hypothetical protein
MDDPARAQFEEWLRYADDLGLAPFFRDREGAQRDDLSSAKAAEISMPTQVTSPASPTTPMPKTRTESQNLPSRAASHPFAGAPLPPVVAPPAVVLPVAAGPMLFDAMDKIEGDTLERIREDLGECTRCKLHTTRHKIVFGAGSPTAKLVFVGEGPGADEDAQGLPFVGRANC